MENELPDKIDSYLFPEKKLGWICMSFFTLIAGGLLLYTVLVWLLKQPFTLTGSCLSPLDPCLPIS
jgi:hypothetical protein